MANRKVFVYTFRDCTMAWGAAEFQEILIKEACCPATSIGNMSSAIHFVSGTSSCGLYAMMAM